MIKVKKMNVILEISENEIERYVTKGYKIIGSDLRVGGVEEASPIPQIEEPEDEKPKDDNPEGTIPDEKPKPIKPGKAQKPKK